MLRLCSRRGWKKVQLHRGLQMPALVSASSAFMGTIAGVVNSVVSTLQQRFPDSVTEDQLRVGKQFDKLARRCEAYWPHLDAFRRSKWLETRWLLMKYLLEDENEEIPEKPAISRLQMPRGMYLHGSVGCGKTMLMDTFVSVLQGRSSLWEEENQEEIELEYWEGLSKGGMGVLRRYEEWLGWRGGVRKRDRVWRVHMHELLEWMHGRVHLWRQRQDEAFGELSVKEAAGLGALGDCVRLVGLEEVGRGLGVVCVDEFNLTDVADALMVSRLLREWMIHGVVIVATSNEAPSKLYQDGLNRESLLPFLEALETQCKPTHLTSHQDFRSLGEEDETEPFGVECGGEEAEHLEEVVWSLGSGERSVRGWMKESGEGGVWLEWEEICGHSARLGPGDYRFLSSLPSPITLLSTPATLFPDAPDIARRFITFVDHLYNSKHSSKSHNFPSLTLARNSMYGEATDPFTQTDVDHLFASLLDLDPEEQLDPHLRQLALAARRARSRLRQLIL